jgi:peptidoglycan/xylan/chitin deacetylase (PgdA/CDA1 family)
MATVLLYHSIADPGADPWALDVSPAHFDAHLQVLVRHWRPMSLEALLDRLDDGAVPEDGVALTFDDGYANGLHTALPLLDRYGIPATFFLPSGLIGRDGECWWDTLETMVLGGEPLPAHADFDIEGTRVCFDLDESARTRTGGRWLAWDPPPTPRQALYLRLWHLMLDLAPDARHRALGVVRDWTGASPHGRSRRRPLSVEDAVRLGRSPLVHVGAHTVSHPRLSGLGETAQRQEIEDGRQQLERLLATEVRLFAYPFGGTRDYTPETVSLVQAAGYRAACANAGGTVGAASDRYQLPRLFVRDSDGVEFRAWLEAQRG